jgi:SAM-dependent methyltransferase
MSAHLAWLEDVPRVNGVYLASPPSPFEERYGAVRAKEHRILTDEQVRRLPKADGLWNADEWHIRERSAVRLVQELNRQGTGSRILEVGCGNGWLSAYLQHAGHSVLGTDAFTMELEQAARVFPNGPVFARADLFASPLPVAAFDVVVFAASIQYFSDVRATLRRALDLLRPNGSIHVLDTILYRDSAEASAAQERSRAYYASIGFPEMVVDYHAHPLAVFLGGHAQIIASPPRFPRLSKFLGATPSPFTHVEIRKR